MFREEVGGVLFFFVSGRSGASRCIGGNFCERKSGRGLVVLEKREKVVVAVGGKVRGVQI